VLLLVIYIVFIFISDGLYSSATRSEHTMHNALAHYSLIDPNTNIVHGFTRHLTQFCAGTPRFTPNPVFIFPVGQQCCAPDLMDKSRGDIETVITG